MAEAKEKVLERKPILNKSSTFVRSMLGYSPMFFGNMHQNTYISINPDRMYLVFYKPTHDMEEEEIERYTKQYPYIFDTLRQHSAYEEEKSINKFDIFIFSIPDKYKEDFFHFIEGSYSKMSVEYKEEMLALHSPIPTAYDRIKGILYPMVHHREYLAKKLGVDIDMIKEIFSRMDYEDEIFDINKLT